MDDAAPCPGRVLITQGHSLRALVVARSLAHHGIEVFAGDEYPLPASSFSRHVTGTFSYPPASEGKEAFLAAVSEAVDNLAPDAGVPYVLMPIGRRTRVLAEHRQRFEPRCRVAAPAAEHIGQVMPKGNLVETAMRHGISIPRTWEPADEEDLRGMLGEIPQATIVKLPDGSGGVGLERVESHEELLSTYRRIVREFEVGEGRPLLVQEVAPGSDFCATVLMDRGQLRASMAYRNLHTFPVAGGFGVVRESVAAPKVIEETSRLLGAMGWHGVAEADFMWTGEEADTPSLLEVNPRFWGGLFQSVEAGIDFPWLLYRLTVEGALGEQPPAKLGVRTRIPIVSAVSELEDLLVDELALDQVREALRDGWDELTHGEIWQGLATLATALEPVLDARKRVKHVVDWLEQTLHTRTEGVSGEDPFVFLGILYILGSLLRYGRLPEEIARGKTAMLEDPFAAVRPRGEEDE